MKAWLRRHWPPLRLRAILFLALLFVAVLPVGGAVFLRVFENTLVRQTEAELIAQGAALVAAIETAWPGADPAPPANPHDRDYYRPETTTIDLSRGVVLPERPAPGRPTAPADPTARSVASALEPVFRRTSRSTLASIVILDRHGVVVRGAGTGGSYAGLPEVAAALAGQRRTTMRNNYAERPRYSLEWLSRARNLRLHHARPVVVHGQVVGVVLLSRSPRALFRGVYEDRGKLLVGLGITFGALLVLSGLVSRGVTRPIEALSAASRRVADGTREAIPDPPATAAIEIRALYRDFGAMAEAIDRRSRYLKDFAAAVSHEFKTPLAGIQGAVELLQDHLETMGEADRRRFLDNIAADTSRLSQLVGRLLDLARADMARPDAGAVADLKTAAESLWDQPLPVEHRFPPDLPAVAVPAPAIEAVLATLAENARQAGARNLVLSAVRDINAVILSVQDDGPGVPDGDREQLFEPFFTTRRSAGGTGLGLSIARSVLAASHASIGLGASSAGARFEIRLPVARGDQAA
jgi:signal transduction histidine kinase